MHIFSLKIPKQEFEILFDSFSEIIPKIGKLSKIEDVYEITLQTHSFKNHFADACSLIRKATESEDIRIEAGGRVRSPGFMLGLIEKLEAYEERIHDRKNKDDNQPEGWGYDQLNTIDRYLPENSHAWFTGKFWFHFGSFEVPGLWRIDKNQIRAILKQQAEDAGLHLCPSFEFSKTEGIIDRLPDVIDTRDNPNWSVLFIRDVEGSRIRERPAGVIHKLSNNKAKVEKEVDQEQPERKRNIPKVSFDEIGGIDSVISQVREIVELPLKNPGLFKHLGIKPHKGVMLYGHPGCGKTMIAKAIAHEVNAHFISVKGPELINKYYGQSEENLRKLFDEAREMEPSIIFFDEIDAVAQKRSGSDNLRMDARFVNQLLSLMDGVEDFGRVCIVAATNRVELIDEALLRPGRFDYQLEVELPDEKGCQKILEITTKGMPVSDEMDKAAFSSKLMGLTGADIAFVAREAAYNSMRRNLDLNGSFDPAVVESFNYEHLEIDESDFLKALKKIKPNNVE